MENWSEDQTQDFQSLPGIEPGTAAFTIQARYPFATTSARVSGTETLSNDSIKKSSAIV